MDDVKSSNFFVVITIAFFAVVIAFSFLKVLQTPEEDRKKAHAKSISNELSLGIKKDTLFLMRNGSLFFFIGKPSEDKVRVLFGNKYADYRISDFSCLVLRIYPPDVGGAKGRERAEYLRMIQTGKSVVKLGNI